MVLFLQLPMSAEAPYSPAPTHEIESSPGLSISSIEAVQAEAPSPAERFAAHVDALYNNDIPGADILRRTVHPLRYLMPRMACGALLGESTGYMVGHMGAIDTPAVALWTVGATGLAVGGNKMRREYIRRRYIRDNGEIRQDESGHAYELYRSTNKETGEAEISMEWFGRSRYNDGEERNFADDVYDITRLASSNGISEITVGRDILKQSMPGHALPEMPAKSEQQFMRSKGIRPFLLRTTGKQRELYTFTPDELRSYVESRLGGKGIHGLCAQLTRLNDNDPVAQRYGQLQHEKCDEPTLRSGLEEAVRTQFKLAINGSAYAVFKVNGAPVRARTDSVKDISGETVTEYRMLRMASGESMVQVDFSSLDEQLAISKQDLETFTQDPALLSSDKQRAILYRQIYKAARKDEGATEEMPTANTRGAKGGLAIHPQYDVGTQQVLVQAAYSYPWFSHERQNADNSVTHVKLKLRALAGVGALLIGGAATMQAHTALDQQIKSQAQRLAGTIEGENLSEAEVYRQAASQSIFTDALYNLGQYEDQLTKQFSKPVIAGIRWVNPDLLNATTSTVPTRPDPLSKSVKNASTGDSSATGSDISSTNEIEWRLDAHEMDTAGYWGLDTLPVFDEGRWIKSSSDHYATLGLPTAIPDARQPHVEVFRTISDLDARTIAIPVLNGTRPVAANFNGKPVEVNGWINGAYTIQLPQTEETGKLSYTVVPAPTKNLKATTPAKIPYADYYDKTAADLWQHALLGARSSDTKQRIAQEQAYIKENFTYNLGKLDGSTKTQYSIGNTVDKALTKKRADCFIASTILAADNPTLNVAHGWANQNLSDRPQILSSHESHAWNVDSNGRLYDAQPHKGIEKFTSYFDETHLLNKDLSNHTNDTPNYLAGIVVAATLGYAYRRRRQITRAIKQMRNHSLMLADTIAQKSFSSNPAHLAQALAARELVFVPDSYTSQDKAMLFHARVLGSLRKSQGIARTDLLELPEVSPKLIREASKDLGLPRNVVRTIARVSLTRHMIQRKRMRDYETEVTRRKARAKKAQLK